MAFLILNPVNSTLRPKLAQLFACVCLLANAHIQAQETVRAHSEVLGTNAPFSFPEKVVVGRNNDIYFLDTTLFSIFVQDFKSGNIQPLCGAEAIRSPSDISVDHKGQLWVLSHNGSRISKLNRQCAVSAEITLPNLSLRIGTNAFGEVIILQLSVLLPIAIFLIAAGAVYFSFTPRRTEAPEPQSRDKIPGVEGLNEGDVINLPTLSTLDGQPVSLSQSRAKRVLCVFFSPSCSGCTKDAELWKDLENESTKRGVAFYIIDVGNDDEALKKLVTAYKLAALPVLFDPSHRVGPALKINFVPSYLLFASDGKVLHRWDGVRNYERAKGFEQLKKFFQYDGD